MAPAGTLYRKRLERPSSCVWLRLLLSLILPAAAAADRQLNREEGVFRILAGGREMGSERFEILLSGDKLSARRSPIFATLTIRARGSESRRAWK